MLKDEVEFLNPTYKEPIVTFKIHSARYGLLCQICKVSFGAPVQCAANFCYVALHPRCARSVGCLVSLPDASVLCPRHSNLHNTTNSNIAQPNSIFEIKERWRGGKRSKKLYQIPTIPRLSFDNIIEFLQRTTTLKSESTVQQIARYWSLKRCRRHGFPLNRSCFVESWPTAEILANCLAMKNKYQQAWRELKQLELVTETLYHLQKLFRSRTLDDQELLNIAADPQRLLYFITWEEIKYVAAAYRSILQLFRLLDVTGVFSHPVDLHHVPDYCQIIKDPVDLETIRARITDGKYLTPKHFTVRKLLFVFHTHTMTRYRMTLL
jgi:hypothetical protein